MEPTPVELDEIIDMGLTAQPRNWRHPFRRRYIPLPARAIGIRGRIWYALSDDRGRWGYSPRQARQIKRALAPVLEDTAQRMHALIDDMLRQAH